MNRLMSWIASLAAVLTVAGCSTGNPCCPPNPCPPPCPPPCPMGPCEPNSCCDDNPSIPKPGTDCLNWPAYSDPANPLRDGAWYLREIICCAQRLELAANAQVAEYQAAHNPVAEAAAQATANGWRDVVASARCCLLNGQPPCTSHTHTHPSASCEALLARVKEAWVCVCGQGCSNPEPASCLTELNHEGPIDRPNGPTGPSGK